MNKILIVDDNPSDLKILNAVLVKKGFEVTQTTDAYAVVELISKTRFDLVILDWMMPNISGLELLKTIRNQDSFKNIPVIFVTSKSETKDIKKAIEEGITDYLVKPLDPMILESKVSKILNREDAWRMSAVPELLGKQTTLKIKTEIIGVSEIAIQIKSSSKMQISEIVLLESEFLKKLGISEVQFRIHECQQKEDYFVVLGILVGMKESEMKAIRMYVNSTSAVSINSKVKKD